MAKIVHSDLAPAEVVHYSLAGAEFDLGGRKKAFETDDREVISDARVHPWLSVEADASNAPAADDAPVEETQPVAIDAGLDQTKSVTTDEVAETLAADETSKTSNKKDKN